jgi:redox-sensitive bicupin YhaK (pirin superfamily)
MFPLLQRAQDNPVELFQIWLNLPAEDKMAEPHFSMLWSEEIPRFHRADSEGKLTHIALIAGEFDGHHPPPSPPRSWASRPDADVAIWTLRMEPGAKFTLPPAKAKSNRTLYFFAGKSASIAGHPVRPKSAVRVVCDVECEIINGETEGELLLLQGRPIGQPLVSHGPFVMIQPICVGCRRGLMV